MFKRGQGEVVGLLVLVILLIFVGFLYLKFSLPGGKDTSSSIRQSLAASGLLHALVMYETGGERFVEWVSACAHDMQQCSVLHDHLEGIFAVVVETGQEYRFVLKEEQHIFLEMGTCSSGIISRVPFTFEGELYEGLLTFCRG